MVKNSWDLPKELTTSMKNDGGTAVVTYCDSAVDLGWD